MYGTSRPLWKNSTGKLAWCSSVEETTRGRLSCLQSNWDLRLNLWDQEGYMFQQDQKHARRMTRVRRLRHYSNCPKCKQNACHTLQRCVTEEVQVEACYYIRLMFLALWNQTWSLISSCPRSESNPISRDWCLSPSVVVSALWSKLFANCIYREYSKSTPLPHVLLRPVLLLANVSKISERGLHTCFYGPVRGPLTRAIFSPMALNVW